MLQTEYRPVQEAIAEVKTALEGTDTAAIEAACQKLETSSHALAAELYKTQDSPGAGAPGPETGPDPQAAAGGGNDDVIDAEVVDQEKGA